MPVTSLARRLTISPSSSIPSGRSVTYITTMCLAIRSSHSQLRASDPRGPSSTIGCCGALCAFGNLCRAARLRGTQPGPCAEAFWSRSLRFVYSTALGLKSTTTEVKSVVMLCRIPLCKEIWAFMGRQRNASVSAVTIPPTRITVFWGPKAPPQTPLRFSTRQSRFRMPAFYPIFVRP
jgi:hypothetical protein